MAVKRISQNKPLCQEHRDKLSQYMMENGLTRAGLGKLMGYEESTFRGIMKGRNILRKNQEKIAEFIRGIASRHIAAVDLPKPGEFSKDLGIPNEAEEFGITGNEEPTLPKDMLERNVQVILQTAESLELQIEPFLTEYGIGDRRVLRTKTGKTLTRVLTLLRGASSEAVLTKMITDDPDIFKQ